MNVNKIIKIIIVLIIFLISPLYAHKPIFDKTSPAGVVEIKNPQVSQVVYHDVDSDGKILWFKFDGRKGQEVYISIGIPVIERLKDFRPALGIFGQGFPEIENSPIKLPLENGILFLSENSEGKFFHEGITNTDSWILVEQTIVLPKTGTFYVAGFTYDKNTPNQKFWLTIGTKEQFGVLDVFALPGWTKKVREFHELE